MSKFDAAITTMREARADLLRQVEALDAAIALLDPLAAPLALPAPAPAKAKSKSVSRPRKAKPAPKRAVARRDNPARAERDDRIRALVRDGKDTAAIAAALGVTAATALYHLHRLGLPVAKKGRSRARGPAPSSEPAPKRQAEPEPSAPAPEPVPARTPSAPPTQVPPGPSDETQIAEFLATRGVTREVDFGEHAAIVAAARSFVIDVQRAKKGSGRPWLWNGREIKTTELYEFTNRELARRGLEPIPMPKNAKAAA